MEQLNETHDPGLHSWVDSAQAIGSDFPIQNLPFTVFRRPGEPWRGGVAIGDAILDLAATAQTGLIAGQAGAGLQAGAQEHLNALMAMGCDTWSALRLALSRALRTGAAERTALAHCLVAQSDAEYRVPARIGDYTDFYTSIHHASNVGRLFRPDSPLLPNYKWVPIGYHGRSSSIGISGQGFPRPLGQTMRQGALAPEFGPSKRLDFELELGIYVGTGNAQGDSIAITHAEDHVFGLCLLNDWSARDLQSWEYQPLGPFLSKNFASTVSPWIVTLEALAPYRAPFKRPEGDPEPLPYLDSAQNRIGGALDIQLQVEIQTQRMREQGHPGFEICRTNYQHAYWTLAQLVTHHTTGGCNLQPGDLLGTGTLSGPTPDQAGSLIEITQAGAQAIRLPHGESRTWLEDGDSIRLKAWCNKPGAAHIGFGECSGTVRPARDR